MDLSYLISGFRNAALQAINLTNAAGDITGSEEAIAWEYNRDTPYVPSPLLHGDILYFLKGNNILTAVNTTTGTPHYGTQKDKRYKWHLCFNRRCC